MEASSGTEGGSEDSNTNTHTSSPINKSLVFHRSSSSCVGGGVGWGGVEGDNMGVMRINFIFSLCCECERDRGMC